MSIEKSQNKNEVSVVGAFSLENLPEYIESVNEKIKNLEEFLEFEDDTINTKLGIKGLYKNGQQGIVEMTSKLSQILRKKDYWDKASKVMGSNAEYKFNGVSINEVKKAFKSQYGLIEAHDNLKKLREVKSELEKYLTDEHKAKALVSNISEILNS
jgi:hypothetical protein